MLVRTSPVCEDWPAIDRGLATGRCNDCKRRWTWLLGALALAAGFSLMVAAYGVAANRTKAAPKHSQAFGTLKAVLDTIDYLDPQQAYTGQSWWAMWNVWETLLTYQHVDGPAGYKLVPGLAQSLPSISANGKCVQVQAAQWLEVLERAGRCRRPTSSTRSSEASWPPVRASASTPTSPVRRPTPRIRRRAVTSRASRRTTRSGRSRSRSRSREATS